jgi:hypothetical protein
VKLSALAGPCERVAVAAKNAPTPNDFPEIRDEPFGSPAHRPFFRALTSRTLDRTLENALERRNDGLFFGVEIDEALAETAAVVARRDPKQPGGIH